MIRTVQTGSHSYAQGRLVSSAPDGMGWIRLDGGKLVKGKLVPQYVRES